MKTKVSMVVFATASLKAMKIEISASAMTVGFYGWPRI